MKLATDDFWHHFYTSHTVHTHRIKVPSIRSSSRDFNEIIWNFSMHSLSHRYFKNHFLATSSQIHTEKYMETKNHTYISFHSIYKIHPKLCAKWLNMYKNLCLMFSTFTCWASPLPVLLLYFFSLGRYHTATYTVAYVEHHLINLPQFTLLGNAFVSLW